MTKHEPDGPVTSTTADTPSHPPSMIPRLQPFSAGYDLIEFSVYPSDGSHALVNHTLYRSLQMRGTSGMAGVGGIYIKHQESKEMFELLPDRQVALSHMLVPEETLELCSLDRVPMTEWFLVTKPGVAEQLDQASQDTDT